MRHYQTTLKLSVTENVLRDANDTQTVYKQGASGPHWESQGLARSSGLIILNEGVPNRNPNVSRLRVTAGAPELPTLHLHGVYLDTQAWPGIRPVSRVRPGPA